MKSPTQRQIVIGLLALAILAAFSVTLFQNRSHSRKEVSTLAKPPVVEKSPAVPAPPPLPAPKQKAARNYPNASPTQTSSANLALLYDENLSFESNLQRLKEFCRSHFGDQRSERLINSFLKALFERANTRFAAVKLALEGLDGSVVYKNILLACLMQAEGALSEKATIVWRIALDSREPVEVRRTASFLTTQVDDGQPRTADLYALLSDADAQVALFALGNSTRHLDQRSYDLIRTNLANSRDIHLRVAAINAIGSSVFADSQTTLTSILANAQTSKDSAFSEPSLLKRAAIPHLDMHKPEVFALVRRIALDDAEDPGVRAKAIGRFTPAEFPAETGMLLELLRKLDANDTVPLRAVVDTLLTAPTPDRIQTIRAKADEMSDPQIRNLLLKRIEIATQNRGP